MILPIGLENTTLKRLPWVTFSIIGLCTLVLLLQLLFSPNLDSLIEDFGEAGDYFAERWQYLEMNEDFEFILAFLGVDPEEFQETIQDYMSGDEGMLLYSGEDETSLNGEQVSKLQQLEDQNTLDEMVRDIRNHIEAYQGFYTTFAYVSADPGVIGLFGHMFMHADFMHLFFNMLLLYLMGTAIEDRWGFVAFPIFYLLGGVFACLMYAAHFPNSTVPLVGASGAISAVLGAFLIKCWQTRIKVLFVFWIRLIRVWSVPAWVMLPLWFSREVLYAYIDFSLDPGGESGGVAYLAHIYGFVFGVAVALIMVKTKLEKKINPSDEDLMSPLDRTKERVARAKREGKLAEIMDILREGVKEAPDDEELLREYYRTAINLNHKDDIVTAGRRLVRFEMVSGDIKQAYVYLKEVNSLVPLAQPQLALVIKLAEKMVAEDLYMEAEDILGDAYERATAPGTVHLVRMAEVCLTMKSKLGFDFITLASQAPDLTEVHRKRLVQLKSELTQATDDGGMAGGMDLSVAVADNPWDQEVVTRVHALKVFPMTPIALSQRDMMVDLGGGRQKSIPYDQIKVLGSGVIRDGVDKPYLIIDLVFDPLHAVLEHHRVLRMTSNTINIRTLIPKAAGANDGLVILMKGLLSRSGADPMPSRDQLLGKPYAVYGTVREYERKTYFPN